ncbi:MAG: hypothetical protein ACREQC_12390, partial [Candidatus Binataceae bacterium]
MRVWLRRVFGWRLLVAAVMVLGVVESPAGAATVTGASMRAAGSFVEIRFDVRGRGFVWHLHGKRQQLTIEFAETRIEIAPRPFAGRELAPITTVAVADPGPGAARIVIGVDGKVDYAATLAGHELIVRFARAGTAPDLAAPIRTARAAPASPIVIAPAPVAA